MEKPSELTKRIEAVLAFLEGQDLSPDRQIAILRGAADIVQQIVNTEYQVASLQAIMQKTLDGMDR